MRKRVPFSTVLLFIAIQSTLLIDVTHTPTGHDTAVNPHAIPNPQGTPRISPLPDDDEAAHQLLAAGHLQEAQDEYLRLLVLRPPDDSKALQGLVTARRRMANDNLATLREQANTYKRALTSGRETNEHYTQASLRFIYIATLIAAAQVEAERSANTPARPSAGPPERRPGRSAPASGGMAPGSANAFGLGLPIVSHVITLGVTPSGVSSLGQPQSQAGTASTVSPKPVAPSATLIRAARPAPSAVLKSPSPESDHASVTVAVTPGPRTDRVRSVGTLRVVDCQRQTLGVDTSRGGQEFSATSNTFISAGTEKLTQFCGLQRFVGSRIRVWGWRVGARHIAWLVYVFVPSAQMTLSRAGDQEADSPLALLAGQPDPVTTPDPGGNDPKPTRSERTGIITAKINDAALVVSRDGVHPIVITSGTRIVGLRTTFGAVTRLDSVRASGWLTQTGTLIADVIEVTNIPTGHQVQQINALGIGALMFNDLSRIQGIVGMGSVAGGASVDGGGSMHNGGTSVSAGASVNGGASASSGGTSVSAGASVNGGASLSSGGTSVSAGASVNGGASLSNGGTSVGAGASVNGGASLSNGGTSVNAGASVSGGTSVSGGGTKGGASVNGGASVGGGGVSVGGGLSVGGVGGVSGGASGSGAASSKDGGTGQH